MRYVLSSIEEYQNEQAYRFYIADSLYYSAQNKGLSKKFYEILEEYKKPIDLRTGDDIAEDIFRRHGLRIKDERI